jgi:predicted alpha/beta superfamily hydrolase
LKRFILFILSAGCLALFSCQDPRPPGEQIIIGETVTVPSRHLSRDMVIDVGLPAGYAGKSGRYPVLVTCQSHFLHVTGIAADLAGKNSAPELIVASVRNYSSGDLIPEKVEGHPDSGGADRFIAFFRDELIPALDSRFRTRPFRIFYSGSFGGGFAVYMYLTQPGVFNACLSATPAIDYEGGSALIMDNLPSYLAKNSYQDRFLYLGVEDEPRLLPLLEKFVGILEEADPAGAKWEYHPFLDEDHGSIANRVIYHGLRFVFSGWNKIPDEIAGQGVGAIRSYASALGKTYGYDAGLSRFAVATAVRSYRDQGRAQDVIDLLKLGLEYEPDAEMLWLQLGRALESNGQFPKAREALETAHKKAVQNQSPHLGIFTDALDKIGRKLRQTP